VRIRKYWQEENQVEVCQSDVFGEPFDEAFRSPNVAASSLAGGVRVRRHREDHDDRRDDQPYIAFQSF
jgi:hypothetical protein